MRHSLAVAALAFALYLPTLGNGFVAYDDPVYLTENPHVLGGLTLGNLRWSLTAVDGGSWHPLTWWSHQLAVTLFGTRPWGHHLVSALLHAAAAGTLCAVLSAMTGAGGAAFLAAALFAVHPLHVESVAWVAERKDVLAALFWMLAAGAWVSFARRPCGRRYGAALALFALGLAAKPILVALPLVLLVVDCWPLGRLRAVPGGFPALVREKLPFLLLALAAGVATLLTQPVAEGHAPLAAAPAGFIPAFVAIRLENAMLSTALYLSQTLWPARLAPFYPHPTHAIARSELLLAGLLLAGATAAAFRLRRRRPWLGAGWAWYLIALLPVIGIVQVGDQGRADRYTYLPLVGIFIAAAWSARELARRGRRTAGAVASLAAAALVLLALASVRQMRYWRDTVTLFTRTLAVTTGNFVAHGVLGEELRRGGQLAQAELHFREALRFAPLSPRAHNRLGLALHDQGRLQEAVASYREAVRIKPDYDDAWNNLGNGLVALDRPSEGEAALRRSLALSPGRAEIWFNLGIALALQGRFDEAAENYRRALALKPDLEPARTRLDQLLRLGGGSPGAR
ncbi:MAG TPA: tetratricopeptide repeat protein [Candidatus Methanoperedens sp.]|nr:tetratricopeptide repeat protein [Candidatus Methanoperedens sp.]